MSPHEQPDDLGRLLNDAVSDIEPRSGIQAIRSRTSAKESVMNTTRNWIFGAFGAAVATAAVITGVVLAGNNSNNADDNNGPVGTPTDPVSQLPTEDPTNEPTDPATSNVEAAVPVYYVGETPQGPRLYREFQQLEVCPNPGCLFSASASQAVLGMPDDPDYRNPWPGGATEVIAEFNGDFITVNLEGDAQRLHDGPAGITQAQADIAIQSLIYSAQAGLGKGRPAVQLLINGSHTDQVLGQPASEPIANGKVTDTLALVNLTTPASGEVVTGDSLKVSGVANSFEANVVIRLQRYEGTYIAFDDFITAEGCCEEKLFPFSKSFDISTVEPGTYILMASTDDPSAGEGPGPHTDTKIITIK